MKFNDGLYDKMPNGETRLLNLAYPIYVDLVFNRIKNSPAASLDEIVNSDVHVLAEKAIKLASVFIGSIGIDAEKHDEEFKGN